MTTSDAASDTAPAAPPPHPWPELGLRGAALAVIAWTAVVLAVSLLAHPTPFYTVETDLVGEYLPAARELARGVLDTAHYTFKGPGYPLALALASRLLHGDVALAARWLGPIAAGVAAWFAYALLRLAAGPRIATFGLAAMLALPVSMRYAIEAGTDMPAAALMLGSTSALLRGTTWRWRVAAGLLAALAALTRTNALFLAPVALVTLARRPGWARALPAYAAGLAAPLAVWAAVARHAGGLPPDRNYLNVAWELYGRGVPWDTFEATTGSRFHSMAGVFAFDPLAAAAHIVSNLVVQRLRDLHELVPAWLGVLAAPGLVLLARERSARGLLAHALACALVLATVFYGSRFGLYLAPVYAGAAGAALVWLAGAIGRHVRLASARLAVPAIAAALVLGSCVSGGVELRQSLSQAPLETRVAGLELARRGLGGETILARKPHVAWFAGMRFARMPSTLTLRGLHAWALGQGIRYVFFSPIEQLQSPAFAVLADSDVALPGYRLVASRSMGADHFYTLYRLEPGSADSLAFAGAYHAALLRYEAHRPGSALAALFVADQLLDLGVPAEALGRLDALKRGGARDGAVERMRFRALLALGRLDDAAQACATAMTLEAPTGWHWSQLAGVRWRQRRLGDARECYRRAIGIEPANTDYLEALGRVEVELRDYPAAAAEFERCLRLAPADARMRRFAMGAWQLAGNTQRARVLYDDGVRAGVAPAALTGENER